MAHAQRRPGPPLRKGELLRTSVSSAEAAARAQRFGPNTFAAGQAEPRWHAFVRQYRAPRQIVLLTAGIGSLSLFKPLPERASR